MCPEYVFADQTNEIFCGIAHLNEAQTTSSLLRIPQEGQPPAPVPITTTTNPPHATMVPLLSLKGMETLSPPIRGHGCRREPRGERRGSRESRLVGASTPESDGPPRRRGETWIRRRQRSIGAALRPAMETLTGRLSSPSHWGGADAAATTSDNGCAEDVGHATTTIEAPARGTAEPLKVAWRWRRDLRSRLIHDKKIP